MDTLKRKEIEFRDEEELYVLYYQNKQFYTSKVKLSDKERIGSATKKPIYYCKKSAEEAITNFCKDYNLKKEEFKIIKFVRSNREVIEWHT